MEECDSDGLCVELVRCIGCLDVRVIWLTCVVSCAVNDVVDVIDEYVVYFVIRRWNFP